MSEKEKPKIGFRADNTAIIRDPDTMEVIAEVPPSLIADAPRLKRVNEQLVEALEALHAETLRQVRDSGDTLDEDNPLYQQVNAALAAACQEREG